MNDVPLGNLLAVIATEASEHPYEGSETQKEAWDEVKRRFGQLEAVANAARTYRHIALADPTSLDRPPAGSQLDRALAGLSMRPNTQPGESGESR